MVPIDLIEPYGVASFHGLGGSYANIINWFSFVQMRESIKVSVAVLLQEVAEGTSDDNLLGKR